ncbi:PAS-domain containing protein [Marivita sp. S0852]|uniref:PAS domain-containing hybrid sensor histidine kinase/response regulator n=1 Tax=Marivita sp. S0852 TaxID=3373893 RepID=UPI0039819705
MSLTDPNDSLERQNEKLLKIAESLMRRVEFGTSQSGAAYAQFERAALLEKRVRERTLELERTLDLLHDANAQLARANEETEAARRNLADAIETISEGFALFDPDDLLVMCNSRFCRDFNDTARDLKPGTSFDSYVDRVSRSAQLHLPDHQDRKTWSKIRRKRHKDRRVMFNVRLQQDRWLQVSEHRTTNNGTVVLQTDITDIMRVERQEQAKLRDKQTRMIRATLDHLNQGVCIFDENARLVGWNQKLSTLLSVPARRMRIGASFIGLLDDLDDAFAFTRGMDRAAFRRWAVSEGLRQPISFEVRRGDSSVLHIFGRAMPDRGFVISCTDVTAEREAAQKLYELNEILEHRVHERTIELEDALSAAERANASKSRFVAAASHDLLQPLSAAKLFIASLSDKIDTPHEQAVLSKAETALGAAEQIIDALLNISKLESDGLSFDIRPVALRDVFDPLRDEMEILAAQKGLTLKIVDSSHVVETDPSYLRRIVQNLITNAIRYTDHGRIVVGARRNGASARIEVWDTGPGIAEADQKSIFEEFRRLDTKASNNDGLGLGLAIVERACTRLGHPLGLWSEPGRGSCFMVNVPLARDDTADQALKTLASSPLGLPKAGLIVLLVENDAQLRRALSILMESWGVSVIEAEDADSALELMQDLQITPDAVLLDYQLSPGATGTQLYEVFREKYGPVPGAIVSADRSADLRHETKRLGLQLLLKPVDRSKLVAFLQDTAVNSAQ